MSATTLRTQPRLSIEHLFERYHTGWEAKNPGFIASTHSEDTLFWLHDGSEPIKGREALRRYCIATFEAYDFSQEMGRRLFGADHWVFEWTMVLPLTDKEGAPFTARVEMLDVVTVNKAGEVTRKDVFMNGDQSRAAFARAGIAIEGGIRA
ncbi:MAG: nuclear transport factor 2 family protein [Parvibaculum sp.]|uniref:nuclear transport factor 2 family protein n=1 Tax=Parvibaculum sp. TaxID=2024848 RepID=UPI00349FDCFD